MKKSSRLIARCVIAGFVLVCFGTQQAGTQDFRLKPNFGEITLKAGFVPDPFKKEVLAGGDMVVTVNNVKMKITKAPDFRIQYTAGALPLSFYVRSDADTTLLINLPNGKFIADDDSGGNFNPLITLKKPMSGQYDIWVGTFGVDGNAAKAVLHVTELEVKTPIPKLSEK